MSKSFFRVPEDQIRYSEEPADRDAYLAEFEEAYSKYAGVYDWAVKLLPFWKSWIKSVLPHIQGPRVLEASFGTGYLLTRYAGNYDTHGIDINRTMIDTARRNLSKKQLTAALQWADVESLPYADGFFDTIVNTMAFSGYPHGRRALSEFRRVLKPQGRLLLVDFAYPRNRNRLGCRLTGMMEAAGDIIRDMPPLLDEMGFDCIDQEIGGWGAVHLYIATKRNSAL